MIRRRILGMLAGLLYPGSLFGRVRRCARCWMPWDIVESHSTKYKTITGEDGGCHPLCEICISELTPAKRIRYYRKLFIWWVKGDPGPGVAWETLRDAVLAEPCPTHLQEG